MDNKKECYKYLDILLKSGNFSIFKAQQDLIHTYGLSEHDSFELLICWIKKHEKRINIVNK